MNHTKTHGYVYLKNKSALRCVILIILPLIGNFAVWIYDLLHRKPNNEHLISEFEKMERAKSLEDMPYNAAVFKNINPAFTMDREFVLEAVRKQGMVLQHVDPQFQEDEEIVRIAVTQCGGALEFAHEAFKADREIVLAPVQQNQSALGYAHITL